jgi:citrate lyase beta subunit
MLTRSWLCASALSPNLIDKAVEAGADLALFDLEDAVVPERKAEARGALLARLAPPRRIPSAVRINCLSSSDGLKDLLFILDHAVSPDAILLPKVVLPDELHLVAALFRERGVTETQVFAIIETAASLAALRTLTSAPPALSGLIFGAADFAADLGVRPTEADLQFVLQDIALAAARFRLTAIDSPCFRLRDRARLAGELDVARRLGLAGKIAIHPAHVAAINAAFAPPASAVADARKLVAAADHAGGNAILRVDDEMVGPPFLKYARRVLAVAEPPRRRP